MDKITFNIDDNLKKRFQIAVIKDNSDMTSVLVSLVEEYLKIKKADLNK